MPDITIYQSALSLIGEQFEIELPAEVQQEEDLLLKALKGALAKRLIYLVDHEPEHLKWVLYRIDVNEQKVLTILAEQPLYEAMEMVADLIIQRQIEKAITRREYSKGSGDLSFDL
jgi:hypothetical protein